MRRAFGSFLVVMLICCGVLAAAPHHRGGELKTVTVASAVPALPRSVSHPFPITLREGLAPFGRYLEVALMYHNALLEAAGHSQRKSEHNASLTGGTAPRGASGAASTVGSVNATGSVNGYPCGGTLPSCCTLRIESHGTPTAQNPSSSASGLWQFLTSTFDGVTGLTGPARNYSPAIQNAAAAKLYAQDGPAPWYGDGCYPGG